jgi:hypothetical protein
MKGVQLQVLSSHWPGWSEESALDRNMSQPRLEPEASRVQSGNDTHCIAMLHNIVTCISD